MNVYVESNFVLEQALEQEQCESCERLIELASAGSIRLLIPAFSLAEPYIAIMRKASERSRLIDEVTKHLTEIRRSRPHRLESSGANELVSILSSTAERERAGLEKTVENMLKTAEIIPLTSDTLHGASAIRVAIDISPQDSIVLASVMDHLGKTKPENSCFLNRNTKDFDNPNVRDILEQFACKFFGRFDEGLRFIQAQLQKT